MNGFIEDKAKKCECGHFRNEHIWIQKSVTKLAFLGEGFFRVPQEARGECKKCSCPVYYPPKLFRAKRDIEYRLRPKNFDDPPEKRCTRCGRLLSNHKDVNHSFQN